jgi:hypothetical protein
MRCQEKKSRNAYLFRLCIDRAGLPFSKIDRQIFDGFEVEKLLVGFRKLHENARPVIFLHISGC